MAPSKQSPVALVSRNIYRCCFVSVFCICLTCRLPFCHVACETQQMSLPNVVFRDEDSSCIDMLGSAPDPCSWEVWIAYEQCALCRSQSCDILPLSSSKMCCLFLSSGPQKDEMKKDLFNHVLLRSWEPASLLRVCPLQGKPPPKKKTRKKIPHK